MAVLSTPQWWFDNIVVPNYDDFLREPLSERRAFNAFVTTYHMYERLTGTTPRRAQRIWVGGRRTSSSGI